jgi:hypothetical protein
MYKMRSIESNPSPCCIAKARGMYGASGEAPARSLLPPADQLTPRPDARMPWRSIPPLQQIARPRLVSHSMYGLHSLPQRWRYVRTIGTSLLPLQHAPSRLASSPGSRCLRRKKGVGRAATCQLHSLPAAGLHDPARSLTRSCAASYTRTES